MKEKTKAWEENKHKNKEVEKELVSKECREKVGNWSFLEVKVEGDFFFQRLVGN